MHLLLLFPWALLGLVPVALAAYWSLRRPAPKLLHVSALWLWQRAMERSAGSDASRGRPKLAWLLMLLGCALLVLALCQPVFLTQQPQRHIGLMVVPSYELADTPEPFAPVLALLKRLSPADRVRLVLPAQADGASQWLLPEQAAGAVRKLALLPTAAGDVAMPQLPEGVQRTFRFAPAPLPPRPGVVDCPLPAQWPAVVVETFAAHATGDQTEIFLRVRNTTNQPRETQIAIHASVADATKLDFSLPPAGLADRTFSVPGQPLFLAAMTEAPSALSCRFLARLAGGTIPLALLGRQDPHVRHFAQMDTLIQLTADAAKADAVIAIGLDDSDVDRITGRPGLPALLIAPPQPPQGITPLGQAGPSALAMAAHGDHAILSGVALSHATLRRYDLWQLPASPGAYEPILSLDGHPLILINAATRRAYITFDVAQWNTDMAVDEPAFPILLHNVLQHVCTMPHGAVTYGSEALETAAEKDRPPLYVAALSTMSAVCPAPGIYAGEESQCRACNSPIVTPEHINATLPAGTAQLDLPVPAYAGRALSLWLALVVGGCALVAVWPYVYCRGR